MFQAATESLMMGQTQSNVLYLYTTLQWWMGVDVSHLY